MKRAWILGVLLLAGCAGGGDRPQRPQLPRPLALELAAQSDAVAQALRRGDSCEAAAQADALVARVDAVIAGGRVPIALRGPLRRGAAALAVRTTCVQPTPPPPVVRTDDDSGHGKNKGKGKDKGKGEREHKDSRSGGD